MAFLDHIDNIQDERQQCPISFFARHENRKKRERPAIIQNGIQTSYESLDQLIHFAEIYLETLEEKRGWAPGKRIAIEVENTLEYVVLIFACFRSGMEVVLLSPEESTILKEGKLDQVALTTKDILEPQDWPARLASRNYELMESFWMLHSAKSILFSSGSSGRAKAIAHNLSSHWFSAIGSSRNIPLQEGDRWLLALPCFHMGGLSILFRSFIAGACVVIADGKEISSQLSEHDVTHCSLVSRQLRRLVDERSKDANIDKLKHVLIGGSSIPESLVAAAIACHIPIHLSYGSTEMASQIATTSILDHSSDLRKSGKTLPFRSLKIANDGQVMVRGECLFLNRPLEGDLELSRGKQDWYPSGDFGHFDTNGQIIIEGRIDNMFISGGENIHPEIIEKLLLGHPILSECWVVPINSEKWGQRPVAFIAPHSEELENNLRSLLQDQLPKFMHPDHFLTMPELPTGKLKHSRKDLRKLAESLLKE